MVGDRCLYQNTEVQPGIGVIEGWSRLGGSGDEKSRSLGPSEFAMDDSDDFNKTVEFVDR